MCETLSETKVPEKILTGILHVEIEDSNDTESLEERETLPNGEQSVMKKAGFVAQSEQDGYPFLKMWKGQVNVLQ